MTTNAIKTCLSINCPERKSVCCEEISTNDNGQFVCSQCGTPFIGGECTAGEGKSFFEKVKLTQGKFTFIDYEDLKKVNKYKWHARKDHSGFYAAATQRKTKNTVLLHRFILNAKKGQIVDHINRNTLDNRKINLRFVNLNENKINSKIYNNNKSGYRGVHWNRRLKKWIAQIRTNRKEIHLGCFVSKREAANAYNIAAVKYHGFLAQLNKL